MATTAVNTAPAVAQMKIRRAETLLRLCAASFGNTAEPQGGVDWNDVKEAVAAATELLNEALEEDAATASAFTVFDLLTIAETALQAAETPSNGRTASVLACLLRVVAESLGEAAGSVVLEEPLEVIEDAVMVIERIRQKDPCMDAATSGKLEPVIEVLREVDHHLYRAHLGAVEKEHLEAPLPN